MSTYDKLDGLIVDAIKSGKSRINFIKRMSVLEEAIRISGFLGRDTDRIVDGRLQALRKRGLIEHRKGQGWVAVSKEAKC